MPIFQSVPVPPEGGTTGAENVADPGIDVIDVGVGAWALVARAKRLGAFGYGNF
jgi:aspartyl aminopeptidase